MNKILLLAGLIIFSRHSFAQVNPSWAWGEDYSLSNVVNSTYHNDYIYVIGNYFNTIQIGSTMLSNAGGSDTYLAKWDTLGNLIWAKSISDIGDQIGMAVHVNSANQIVIAGNFSNPSLVIGNDTLFSGVIQSVYSATFDLSGNIINAFGIPSASCTDFCLDNADNIYINTWNGLKKFTSSGVFIWQKPYGAQYIHYSALGSCIMGTGLFEGTITLGGTTITAGYSATWGSQPDIYAIQFDLNGNVNWLTQVTNNVRGEAYSPSYLRESTGDLFIASMLPEFVGQYNSIYSISLSGSQISIPFDNVASGVVIPSTFVGDYPFVTNISGRDSFLSFMLNALPFSGTTYEAIGVFNLNSQETILGLNCYSDYHMFRGLNSIYMKGTASSISHTFGKLGTSLLTSPNTYFTNHYCVGSSANLVSNVVGGVPPLTYSWAPSTGLSSTSANTVSFTANANITYILTVSDANGQVVKDTFDIIVDTPLNPLVITPQNSGFCHDRLYLFSNLGLSVNWYKYDGLNWNVNFPMFYNDSTIIYEIGLYRASISNYCNTVSDTLQIDPIAIVNANASSLNICTGQPLTLFGSGALTYTWSGGALNNIAFNPSMSQTYTVTGIDINGCIHTDTISVGVNPTSASTTNISICSSALPYVWNSQSLTSTGIYTSIFINGFGCDSIASLNLMVNPTSASTTNISICSNALPYVWNSQSLTSSGIYTTNLINSLGCDSIASLNLAVNPNPQPTIIQNNYNLTCTNTSNSNYSWYFNGTSIGTNDSVLAITQDGEYVVKVTDSIGCIGYDTIKVIGLGIDHIETDHLISIYPNPTSGQIQIAFNLDEPSIISLKILDIQGRLLFIILDQKEQFAGKRIEKVDLKSLGLSSGIYLFSGEISSKQWTKRISYFDK